MAENVVIGIESDVSGLNKIIDDLERLGQVDKKTADEFRVSTKQYTDRQKAVKDTGTELDNLGKKAETSSKKVKAASKESSDALGGLGNVAKQIGEGIVAAFAVERIISFGKESINAFVSSQEKTEKLRFALENISKDGGSFDRLIKQSEQLQESLRTFDAEDIQGIQAMQAEFGLTANQIERLTPLILELSTIQKVDLATATDTALKAVEGQTRGLKTVGASFKDTGSSVENFNLLVQNLSKFEGSAADSLNTVNGQLKAQQVEAENLQESIGQRLAPAILALKNGALEAADALVSLFLPNDARTQAVSDIERLKGIFKNNNTDEIKAKISDVEKQIIKLKQEAKDLPFDLDRGERLDEIKDRIDALTRRISAGKSVILDRQEAEKKAAEDAKRNADLEVIAKQNLSNLTKKQLQDEISVLKERKDANSKDVQDQIERRQAAIDALAKLNDDAAKKAAAARQSASDKLREQTLKDQQDALSTAQTDAIAKLNQDKKNAEENAKLLFEQGNKSKADKENLRQDLLAIDQKFDAEILKAQNDLNEKQKALNEKNLQEDLKSTLAIQDQLASEQAKKVFDAFQAKGDFSKQAQEELSNELSAIEVNAAITKDKEILASSISTDEEKINAKRDIAEQELKLAKDTSKQKIAIQEQEKQIIQEIEDTALSAILDAYSQSLNNQIELLGQSKEEQSKVFDDAEQKNQDRRDKGIIGEREFRAEEKRLNDEKVKSEQEAQKKINDLKRKADIANRIQKLFEIGIATARNAIEQPGPLGVLIPYWLGLGGIQAAAVLATPLPKYKKGTLNLQGANDEVPIIAHRGEAITPSEQSKEYRDTLAAIHGRTIPFKVMNDFVKGYRMKDLKSKDSNTIIKTDIDYDKLATAMMRVSGDLAYTTKRGLSKIAESLTNHYVDNVYRARS